ncbi:MAG: CDP-diacylglycerol O-phosphatidyltransferase [Candidatus Binatia bacterium]|nr:CDP-diacylglycerol O-phosphatidyltransferase [Candidatus Binatia bacterium]MDG2010502.1 CDP-diacylglycerol O-phosphatidyltransferase [Candidatus Binatia bacterium]
MPKSPAQETPMRHLAAWSVHFFTAFGTICTLGALYAIQQNDIRVAFFWLSLAVVIDAMDGALARLVRVKEVLPVFDGAKLDDIVDYMTFVMVPVYLMLATGILEGAFGVLAASAAVLASAYRFCHVAAKTEDHFFTGFPSYWNILTFYLYIFAIPPTISAMVTFGLAILVFAPLKFIYPSRTLFMRPTSVILGILWGLVGLVVVDALPERRVGLAAVTLLYPIYYTGLSFYLQWKGSGDQQTPPDPNAQA